MNRDKVKIDLREIWGAFKVLLGIIVSLLILIYAIYQLVQGQGWLAFASLLTLALFIWVAIRGFNIDIESVVSLCGIIALTSVIGAYNSSAIANSDNTKMNIDLMLGATKINYCPAQIQPNLQKRNRFNQLKNTLFTKCIFQNHSDVFSFAIDISLAKNLDPFTGLAYSAYKDFKHTKEYTCIDVAQEMDLLCPSQNFAFIDLWE